MASFYLMTKNGSKPPSYLHYSLKSAITEAERLHALFKTDVMILEVVGKVFSQEVPVTKTVVKTELNRSYEDDELPF